MEVKCRRNINYAEDGSLCRKRNEIVWEGGKSSGEDAV